MVNDNFYLAEAFKSMKLLEDDFDLTTDNGVIDELQSFVADDVEAPAEEVIIDVEADNEDELQDNYIGKVILECDCCHTRIYKNEEEVVIDDESGKANIDEVCPVCNGEFGWNVIGKIEPFKEDEFEETEEETVEEPEEEHEFSDEEVDEALKEALNEDLKVITSLSQYEPWSGAEETYRKIEDAGLLDELEMILEDMYPDGIGMTELNDILWFDADTILSYLGLGEEDEDFDESYDSLKAVSKKLKESIKRREALKEEFIKVDSYDKAKELGKGTKWAISGNYPGYDNDKDGERLFKEYSKNYDIFISPNTKTGKIISKKTGEERVFDKEDNFLYTVKRAKKESKKLRSGKSLKESWYRGTVGVEFIDNGQWSDPQLEYDGHIFNYWDIEDALWQDFLAATGHTDNESGNAEVEAEFDAFVQDNCIPYLEDVIAGGYFGESCKGEGCLKESDESKKTYKCYDCGYEVELSDDEDVDKFINDYYNESLNEAKKVGLVSAAKWTLRKASERLKDKSPEEVYNRALEIAGRSEYPFVKNNLEAKKDEAIEFIKVIREAEWNPDLDESLTEDLNEVEVHTEDGDVNVSKEDSKVTIDFGTSNVEDDFALEGGDEMIAPLTDEEQTEIENNLPDGEEELDFSLEDEEVPEEGEEELDIEDFDEETFDNVGESYMRRVYDNVDSFNTTRVSTSKNKMMVEGTINFKSGKKKDTKFVFEGLRNTKRGKVVFNGLNETFSKSNKAFMLKGTLKNKKFVTESMIYNYYAKSLNESDGKSVKVYGRAVAKK